MITVITATTTTTPRCSGGASGPALVRTDVPLNAQLLRRLDLRPGRA